MPEEIAETAPETAPVEVIAAAALLDSQPESPEVQVERFAVAANFAQPSANEDARTIDAVWYTDAKVPRFDWRTGEEYDLILDMKGCRLDRLNNGGPVLDSHAAYGVADQLGVVRKAWAKKGTGIATIQFSKRDAVTPIWNDVKGGIIQNLSPGMWIYKKVDTTPKNQERKEFTATDWEPFEISLVPVPGDANTTFMSAALPPAQPSVVEQQGASAQEEHPAMTQQNQQVAGEEARQNEVALAAARDEAAKEAVRMGEPGSDVLMSQSIDGSSDDVQFAFGNADLVMGEVANDTDLIGARIEFSLFHVASLRKLDLWAGEVVAWNSDAGPEFVVRASDRLSALTLSSPVGTCSRSCWRRYGQDGCPATPGTQPLD